MDRSIGSVRRHRYRLDGQPLRASEVVCCISRQLLARGSLFFLCSKPDGVAEQSKYPALASLLSLCNHASLQTLQSIVLARCALYECWCQPIAHCVARYNDCVSTFEQDCDALALALSATEPPASREHYTLMLRVGERAILKAMQLQIAKRAAELQ